jgi:hypothetical protein
MQIEIENIKKENSRYSAIARIENNGLHAQVQIHFTVEGKQCHLDYEDDDLIVPKLLFSKLALEKILEMEL